MSRARASLCFWAGELCACASLLLFIAASVLAYVAITPCPDILPSGRTARAVALSEPGPRLFPHHDHIAGLIARLEQEQQP